jgi:hypothetical protein
MTSLLRLCFWLEVQHPQLRARPPANMRKGGAWLRGEGGPVRKNRLPCPVLMMLEQTRGALQTAVELNLPQALEEVKAEGQALQAAVNST